MRSNKRRPTSLGPPTRCRMHIVSHDRSTRVRGRCQPPETPLISITMWLDHTLREQEQWRCNSVMVGHRAQRSPRQGPPLATRIRSTARPTCWRLTPRSRLRMALEFSIPGRYSILTTAMTTSMPSPGQARSGFGCGTRESWHDKVGLLGPLYRGLRASEEYCSDYLRAGTHKRCQRLFLACCARAVSVPFPGRQALPSSSRPFVKGRRDPAVSQDTLSATLPLRTGRGSKEGLPAPLRMGGAETNRRSPLPHATPVLLSPSQGCIPAWDDEEVAHVVCPPKWEYRDHPTPEAMRRRASI